MYTTTTLQTDIVIFNDIKTDGLKEEICKLFVDMTFAFISLRQDECFNKISELYTITLVFPQKDHGSSHAQILSASQI